jgi:molecular chaperone GrpE
VHVEEATGRHAAADPQASSAELDALAAQLAERTADLQRISAEYSNYRRRVERDRQLVITMAKAQVVGDLLSVLDDVERAQQHGDLSGVFKAVADKLATALAAQGLEPFGAIGDGFDPEVHEAVHHSTSPDVRTPTVTAVLRLGYRFGDRVLRPAMVAVTDAAGEAVPFDEAVPFGDVALTGDTAATGDAEPIGGAGQLQDN